MADMILQLKDSFQHIVVVDDGCDDSYRYIFDRVADYAEIVRHDINKGKGRALKTGYEYIRGAYADSNVRGVVTADADGQHTAGDIIACCDTFLKNDNSFVFGCRDFSDASDIPPRSRFGNRLTSRLLKFFCDIELSDTQTGLRVVPFNCLEQLLKVQGERYEYEMNCIFAIKDMGCSIVECPIEVIYIDDNKSSHFNPIKDSLKIYKVFAGFTISSLGSSVIDLLMFTIIMALINPDSDPVLFIVQDKVYAIYIATVAARIVSGIFNYSVNRKIFSSRDKVSKSGPRYIFLWVCQMLLSSVIVGFAADLCRINETVIKIVVDTILFFISYKIQQKWVFKRG